MKQLLFDKKNYLSNVYYLCVCLLAIGLCTSKAMVSLSAATIFTLVLFSFKWIDFKFELKKNKSFFFLLLFFIYYCLSSIWSSNLLISVFSNKNMSLCFPSGLRFLFATHSAPRIAFGSGMRGPWP